MNRRRATSEVTFALSGRVDGRQRLFVLGDGTTRIGRGSENDIVLAPTGVSASHAVIEVHGEDLEVRDLASKNGTFVDGKRVASSRIDVGQLVQFGPVTLRVEKIEYEDTWLSIVASEPASRSPQPAPQTSTVVWSGEARTGGARQWIHLLDAVTSELSAPSGGAQGKALGALARGLGASRAALLKLSPEESPLVIASYGDLADDLPFQPLAALRSRALEEASVRVEGLDGEAGRWTAIVGSAEPILVLEGEFADDGITKALLRILYRTLSLVDTRSEGAASPVREGPDKLRFPEGYLAGESAAMQTVYREIGSVAESDIPLLLVGETGVGKECLAKTVHESSLRRDGPFLPINCAAIPADLLEAELFGIAKGVATGVHGRAGRLVVAQGGTVFLDEIGDMSAALQAKLLRALEERIVQPVGGAPEPIDVRLIAATNTDLGRKVDTGEFRRDLYYRLAGLVVTVPPLRKRQNDVGSLIAFFFHQICEESGREITGLTYGAMRRLTERRWPGNVRELQHAVRRLVFLCPEGRAIDSAMVKGLESSALSSPRLSGPAPHDFSAWERLDLDKVSRGLIREAMRRTGGNQTNAAKLLGISRSALRRRLTKLFPKGEEDGES